MLRLRTERLISEWSGGRLPAGPGERLASAGLRMASAVYWLGSVARSSVFDAGLKKIGRVDCPVICVGNLSAGGTGKTPLVIEVARHFRDLGRKVAIVTRGYRRAPIQNSRVVMVSDGERLLVAREAAGDEPAMMARELPGVAVVVGVRRFEAARMARRDWGADLIILDDGFQHRALERDCDIVLWDALQPPESAALLPRGFLREGWDALRRAHALVFTRCNLGKPSRSFVARIKRIAPHLLIFQSTLEMKEIRSLTAPDRILPRDELPQMSVGGFCGLGNPDSFWKLLEANGARLVWRHAFPDHYRPDEVELGTLLTQAREAGAEHVLITEKDAENVPPSWQPEMPILVVRVAPSFGPDTERFHNFLERYADPKRLSLG
jgi:tetraacyldisaccharide 4'-kinase